MLVVLGEGWGVSRGWGRCGGFFLLFWCLPSPQAAPRAQRERLTSIQFIPFTLPQPALRDEFPGVVKISGIHTRGEGARRDDGLHQIFDQSKSPDEMQKGRKEKEESRYKRNN